MQIWRKFADVPPSPETSANVAFRRAYFARWGRENAVFHAATCRWECAPVVAPLTIKATIRGASWFTINGRRVLLDDEHFVVINAGDSYGVSIRSDTPVLGFSISVRPGLEQEVAAGLQRTSEGALDDGAIARTAPVHFAGHLREHDASIMPALQAIRGAVLSGVVEDDWYEEAYADLVTRLIESDHGRKRLADRLDGVKPSTREELLRRIGWATDFINSRYMEAISLDDIARAASLSKFHLARLFRQGLGITPHQYLQRRRTQVARRLIDTTDMDVNEVALTAGFGSRWTMYRFLRRSFGTGGRGLRRDLTARPAPCRPEPTPAAG